MKKIGVIYIASLIILIVGVTGCTEKEVSVWPEVKKESRPWVRWWWMGSAVDKPNLDACLSDYAGKGIGGVEIAPIYGAKGFEDKYIPYLSPKWMEMLKFTLTKADSLGMGVDMTNGTGWPFGGPQVSIKDAATKFVIQKYHLNKDERLDSSIIINDPKQIKVGAYLQALTAYGPGNEIVDLTNNVDQNGILNWIPESDGWTLYALFDGKTRQQVKRAAPGAKGYTFDHLSAEALFQYLARFDSAFSDGEYNIRCFFNDSYEVYKANWSENFFQEFLDRRGYDLRGFLRELDGDGDSVIIAQIKSDYRETMSDMLLENFTENWTEWAHQKGAKTKNQSHGSPANLLDLYGTVDIPEIETFGSSAFDIPGFRRDSADIKYSDTDPLFQKFASSGAHVSGKNLVSCETFTWLREHFKGALSMCKPEVDQVFVSGVNHVFYHGTTYSPKEAGWPGWLFYASVDFAPSNSFWAHIQGMNEYIARCQSVLQAGTHTNDILVYWPVYDIWNNPRDDMQQFTVHNVHSWLHMNQIRSLMDKGYLFDFISDRQIDKTKVGPEGITTSSEGSPYQVLIIPKCEIMSPETLVDLIKLAKSGANIILEDLPKDVPGYLNHQERLDEMNEFISELEFEKNEDGISVYNFGSGSLILAPDIEKGLIYLGIQREKLTDTGLKFNKRHTDYGDYYFIANLTGNSINGDVEFNSVGDRAFILDPMTGNYGLGKSLTNNERTTVNLNLRSGESIIILITDRFEKESQQWHYKEPIASETIKLDGKWSLTFKEGGPTIPKEVELDTIKYWTDLGNEEMNHFSGTAVYSTTFSIDDLAADYLLKVDQLRESAKVIVNGKDAGIVWGLPFELRIGKFIKKGENTILIEVANLMANRIRYKDLKGDVWRNYHEINFVNIGYQPFDASSWDVQPSGLEGPVELIPCQLE